MFCYNKIIDKKNILIVIYDAVNLVADELKGIALPWPTGKLHVASGGEGSSKWILGDNALEIILYNGIEIDLCSSGSPAVQGVGIHY